uniref:WGS project CBMC000000000 data, contig CS3220_c001177 n=1 Tax=Fusarium pseudograminearum CS3220 TaxID=1318456 RepID=A0A096PCB4_FUSPS|nr:unnamed protein product [Fusarium pseudograminearum CS3220]
MADRFRNADQTASFRFGFKLPTNLDVISDHSISQPSAAKGPTNRHSPNPGTPELPGVDHEHLEAQHPLGALFSSHRFEERTFFLRILDPLIKLQIQRI